MGTLEGGSSRGFQRYKWFQQGFQQWVPVQKGVPARGISKGFQQGVLAVPILPLVTETMEKAVAALLGSMT